MEKRFTEQTLELSKLKTYIGEWFLDISSSIEPGKYDSYERIYKIYDTSSSELVYTHTFGGAEMVDESAMVSTSGIINEELRGLVEQCITLDKQLEESKKQFPRLDAVQKTN